MHLLITLYFFLYLLIRHASEVGVLAFLLLGLLVLVVPKMRVQALASVSGWQQQDSWMALCFASVFIFKLVSSLWSASSSLGLNNAMWHVHFVAWPLVVLAMLFCKPKLNHALAALSISLTITGVWMLGAMLIGKHGYYPLIFKINVGVLAELVLVCASLLLVALMTATTAKSKNLAVLYLFGVLGAFVILYSTGRRTEWIAFFIVLGSLVVWHLRGSMTVVRTLLAIFVFVLLIALLFYLRQDRLLQAYREFVQYFAAPATNAASLETSVGARLEMYRLGLTAFWHNPLLGMGSGVRPYLLQAYGGLDELRFPHRHFHSEFLQVLVEGGLVWASALTAAIVYWFKKAVFATWRKNPMLALLAAYLSISLMLAGSVSAGLIYGPANATLIMFSALIWVGIRQSGANDVAK
jgi:O-Antigen ligase